MWWPSNHAEYLYYIQLKTGFFENRVTLLFEKWNSGINSKVMTDECCNSWIRIFGFPWNPWSEDVFKKIGDICGGLLEVCEDTTRFKDLAAAKIKVRGLEGGFINCEMTISLNEGNIDIKIQVDSIDRVVYEQSERQSYAQVVVNGKKTRAGWGNSNIRRLVKAGLGSTNQSITEQSVLNKKKEQGLYPEANKIRCG